MSNIEILDGGDLPPELAAILKAAARNGGSEAKSESLTPGQAAQILREGLALMDREQSFTPGMIVRRTPGIEDGYKAPRLGVLLFVRDLTDEERVQVRKNAESYEGGDAAFMLQSRDCILARLLPDGSVLEFPATKRYLEPHPDYAGN